MPKRVPIDIYWALDAFYVINAHEPKTGPSLLSIALTAMPDHGDPTGVIERIADASRDSGFISKTGHYVFTQTLARDLCFLFLYESELLCANVEIMSKLTRAD